MTTSQISAWLEAMPEAAQLLDESAHIIAQNLRAQSYQAQPKHVVTHDLGDGWRLQTWKLPDVAEPDIRSLANGLAHTLRNPLSSVLTAADLVKDDANVSEESAMLLGIIHKEARQINRILTDFLNYVRPRPSQPATFDLASALRDSVISLKQENALPETVHIQDDLPETLPALGDENAIRQSLRHVVKNAVEAMSGSGTLRLSGETFESGGRVHIEDEGPGFSSESLERAFEPFYSYTPECAGLGLSVAKAAVQRAGGRITIENMKQDSAQDAIEYSNDAAEDSQLVKGARVCIELNAPNGEKYLPEIEDVLRHDETRTI